MMQSNHYKPVILAILDGWGHSANGANNAVALAKTPTMDMLGREFPNGLINASELHVGLPIGQMGNSEVGHMNIGSGRVVMQDLPRIDASIADGTLARNPQLQNFMAKVKKTTGIVHLMGLLSDGGVHSHQNHIVALADILAENGLQVKLHLFLDGRDTPPKSALGYVSNLEKSIEGINNISIATVSGRYYAMDRDNRWDRVQKPYDAMVLAQGEQAKNAIDAVTKSYETGKNDEFVLPTVIADYAGMNNSDGLLMANFRADRVREILTLLLEKPVIKFSATLGMTEYSEKLTPLIPALFPSESLTNILGEIVANAGLKQLRIAETEKYAHVTFFFNGGREQEFAGEERILVPSPNVATYDLKPEMSAPEVTEKLLEAITNEKFDFIMVNYANTDMVGHTGDIQAAIKAVETVDNCLGKLVDAALAKGGALVVTADHGNAEQMFDDETKQPHTAHTLNLVPLIIAAENLRGRKIQINNRVLGDIAPTILEFLNLPQPIEMTGKSLLREYV
jgi:2,3-bisphosphoglycerate-independent phosphoglycerate mutase